jgi:hypothetical protein
VRAAGRHLRDLAHALAAAALDVGGPHRLVGVAAPGPEPDDGTGPHEGAHGWGSLEVLELAGPDLVAELLGLRAPSRWRAVGVVAHARARSTDGTWLPLHRGRLVHVVDRAGTSVTLLHGAAAVPLEVGPTSEPAQGRVADACRRVLGLATAPPSFDMVAYVVDRWLHRVTKAAHARPGLSWAEVVALHPAWPLTDDGTAPAAPPTPAAVAAGTAEFGAGLDWERFRRACVAAGRTPADELSGRAAAWMDAGMFARWLAGEALAWRSAMDVLDDVLAPDASDLVWATLSLCPGPGPSAPSGGDLELPYGAG